MTKLERIYVEYNKKYFRGSLPPCKVKWNRKIKHFGHFLSTPISKRTPDGHTTSDRLVIEISNWSYANQCQWRLTLLHEMVHLKLAHKYGDYGHGHRFQREMKRLANRGAFKKLW